METYVLEKTSANENAVVENWVRELGLYADESWLSLKLNVKGLIGSNFLVQIKDKVLTLVAQVKQAASYDLKYKQVVHSVELPCSVSHEYVDVINESGNITVVMKRTDGRQAKSNVATAGKKYIN